MRLIVPMGGRGTRLRPLSHTTPKALLPVAGKPAIERSLSAFADALPRPVEEAVFVLNPADHHTDVPDRLAAACARVGVGAAFATQEKPLGTAHAIWSAGDYLEGEVLTVWSDTLFRPSRQADLGAGVDLLAWTFEVADPRRFGVITRDEEGRVTGLLEKPPDDRFTETLIGAYYLREGASLREQVGKMLQAGETGAGGEYQLTDALDALVRQGASLWAEPVDEWLDVGTIPAYLDAVARVLDREGSSHPALPGVTIRPPVYISPGATVVDSAIGPHASVEGTASVMASSVTSAVVFDQARVVRSRIENGAIGQRATVAGASGHVLLGDDSAVGEGVPGIRE